MHSLYLVNRLVREQSKGVSLRALIVILYFAKKKCPGQLLLNFYNNRGCSTNRHCCAHGVLRIYAWFESYGNVFPLSPHYRKTELFSVRHYVFNACILYKLFQNAQRNNEIVKNSFFFRTSTSVIDNTPCIFRAFKLQLIICRTNILFPLFYFCLRQIATRTEVFPSLGQHVSIRVRMINYSSDSIIVIKIFTLKTDE